MIKYGVLDEYKCTECGEIIETPQKIPYEELSKFASIDTCAHKWEKLELQKESLSE